MISRCETFPPCPEPLFGCRIETLSSAYRAAPGAVELFQSDQGGILCRFGESLTVAGPVDAAELSELAAFLGIRRIEGLSPFLPALPGFERSEADLLDCPAPDPAPLDGIDRAPEPRDVYGILCRCNPGALSSEGYLYWLSDFVRRKNDGRAFLLSIGKEAVIGVYAMGCGYGLIQGLAVLPGARGRGYAKRLMLAAGSLLGERGLTPVIIVEKKELVPFYQGIGYQIKGKQALCVSMESEERYGSGTI